MILLRNRESDKIKEISRACRKHWAGTEFFTGKCEAKTIRKRLGLKFEAMVKTDLVLN
jgi:hypothetical protein